MERTHTARVHGWFVGSDGADVSVTRRDDGKWYLNAMLEGEQTISFVSLEEAVSAYLLAAEEGRPHRAMIGLPDGGKWDDAISEADTEADTDTADAGEG